MWKPTTTWKVLIQQGLPRGPAQFHAGTHQ